MNKEVMKDFIKYSENDCPPFRYDYPLLDKSVARALSKSLLKILNSELNLSNDDEKRIQILQSIRTLCKTEAPDHLHMDENATAILIDCYIAHTKDLKVDKTVETDKMLDAFLIQKMTDINLSSIYTQSTDAEVIQALLNLKMDEQLSHVIQKDIIHWNVSGDEPSNRDLITLKALWKKNNLDATNDYISIKIKPRIEQQLLEICYEILESTIIELEYWLLTHENFSHLTEMCSESRICFQMCCSIINSIFVKTKCQFTMKDFIKIFIENIKKKCNTSLSVLYPTHLSHIVVLLDINMKNLQCQKIKKSYIDETVPHLKKLHSECSNELIMLLSHYPQWFDIYFKIVPE